jgi:hypothetical protein
MISENDAYAEAEVAAIADAPAGNTEKYQICRDFVDICKGFAPLKNKISKVRLYFSILVISKAFLYATLIYLFWQCSPETGKAKERTSPSRLQENTVSMYECSCGFEMRPN